MEQEIAQEKLSVSRVRCFLRCPLMFYFRYVARIKVPTKPVFLLGKAVHKAIELNLQQKMGTHADLPLKDQVESYVEEFNRLSQEEEVAFESSTEKMDLRVKGFELVELHAKEIAPQIQPLAVEKYFSVAVDDEIGFQGYIDVIDSRNVIRDTKTSAKSYQENAAVDDLQLSGYDYAYRKIVGKPPRALLFDVLVKTKVPKCQVIHSTARTDEQLVRFERLLRAVHGAIKTERYYPCDDPMRCSTCDYKGQCREWR